MSLARCICGQVFDIPGLPRSYKQADGRCTKCNEKSGVTVDIPSNVIQAVKQPKVFLRYGNGPAKPTEIVPAKVKIELVKVELTEHQKSLATKQQKYPFKSLKAPPAPDEFYSFFVPCPEDTDFDRFRARLAVNALYYNKRAKGKARYATKTTTVDGVKGVRVMRTR